jgi:hypothetical protein
MCAARAVKKTAPAPKAAPAKTVSGEAAAPAKRPGTKASGAKAKGGAPRPAAPATRSTAAKGATAQPVAAPPAWALPTVPNGFQPPGVDTVRRRSKPTEQMRAEGVDFAAELRSGATYAEDFGKRAPDPDGLADLISNATAWDALYNAAAPVAEYAMAMRSAAWDAALKPAKKLQAAYEAAVSDEPSLATTWRQTAAFFDAREEPALRGAETKLKAKRAAKKTAKAAANGAPPKS